MAMAAILVYILNDNGIEKLELSESFSIAATTMRRFLSLLLDEVVTSPAMATVSNAWNSRTVRLMLLGSSFQQGAIGRQDEFSDVYTWRLIRY